MSMKNRSREYIERSIEIWKRRSLRLKDHGDRTMCEFTKLRSYILARDLAKRCVNAQILILSRNLSYFPPGGIVRQRTELIVSQTESILNREKKNLPNKK